MVLSVLRGPDSPKRSGNQYFDRKTVFIKIVSKTYLSRCVRNLPRVLLGKVNPKNTQQSRFLLRDPEKSENPKKKTIWGLAHLLPLTYIPGMGVLCRADHVSFSCQPLFKHEPPLQRPTEVSPMAADGLNRGRHPPHGYIQNAPPLGI